MEIVLGDFTYKKIGDKKYEKKCAKCLTVKIVTFINFEQIECTSLTCKSAHYNFLIGKQFGDMKVIKINNKTPYIAECKCQICNTVHNVRLSNFLNKKTGNHLHSNCKKILYKQIVDLNKFQNFYERWRNILRRCEDEKHKSFDVYKDKIISDKWHDFMFFYNDMYDSFETNLQIDRLNNSEGYNKNNCKWVTPEQNCINRSSTINCYCLDIKNSKIIEIGKIISLRKFCKINEISTTAVYDKLNNKTKNCVYKNLIFFKTLSECNDYAKAVGLQCNSEVVIGTP